MKIRYQITEILFCGALLCGLNRLDAQQSATLASSGTATAGSASTSLESSISVIERKLPTPAEAAPLFGTFYSAQNPTWPPMPGNINQMPVWSLGSDKFLLDDLDLDYQALSAQTASASKTLSATGMAATGMDSPISPGGGGGGGGFINFSGATPFNTNLLWLQITNISGGIEDVNLYNATDQVYAVWSTTNLSTNFPTGWQVEEEVWSSSTNCTPFNVAMQGRPDLFLKAEDWTGVTENGNETPEWWFWEYFGTTDLSDTNLDSQGNNLLYDYQNGVDPNPITFRLVVTNNDVATTTPQIALNISAGSPSYCALSLDDTNFAFDSTWQPYTGPEVTVNLGTNQGWHTVWIGLRGLPPNATVTWQEKRLKLILTPPVLVITNPANSTVTQPVIQLQGYSPESLFSISYDLGNAAGAVTNQQVFVQDQYFDTNTWDFTTNIFQAFDIPVTNGLNVITLHATDRAGNVTVTNFYYTLNYSSKTNPPVVNLYWPQNQTLICNSSYTCRGWISDPTATVTAQLVDTNGNTNVFNALVERDGDFWVENIPLGSGSQYLTLRATDVVGNVTVTNITVFPGAVQLTITPPSPDQLWDPGLTVSGTISDWTNYTVWVNGVMAIMNGNGTWTANNVYLPDGGTAVLQARAIPNSDNGGLGTGGSGGGPSSYEDLGNPDPPQDSDFELQSDKPPRLFVKKYTVIEETGEDSGWNAYNQAGTLFNWLSIISNAHDDHNWKDGFGGDGTHRLWGETKSPPTNITTTCAATIAWGASSWPDLLDGTNIVMAGAYCGPSLNGSIQPPQISMEHCDTANFICLNNTNTDNTGTTTFYWTFWDTYRQAQAKMGLDTGGKGLPVQNLFQISAQVYDVIDGTNFPPQVISIGDFGCMGSDGYITKLLPNNSVYDVTPSVTGVEDYTFNVTAPEITGGGGL